MKLIEIRSWFLAGGKSEEESVKLMEIKDCCEMRQELNIGIWNGFMRSLTNEKVATMPPLQCSILSRLF